MRTRNTLIATFAGLALVGGALTGCTSAPTSDPEVSYTPEQVELFEQLMTFHETSFECEVNELGLVATTIYAVPAYGPGSDASPKRVNTNDISIPLVGTTVEELAANADETRCIDPLVALTQGYAFGNMKVPGSNKRVFDLEGNEKLKLADVKLSELSNLARTFVYEKGDDRDTFIANNDVYQEYVSTLVSILDQASVLGVHSFTSVKNWMLESGSAGIGNILLNPEDDSLSALVYGFTVKGECVPAVLFGVNLEDQRPEIFNPKDYQAVCDTPPTPTPTTTPTPGCEKTGTCGGCELCAKVGTEDVGANTEVDDFYQDGGEKHVVSEGDGAKIANGNQGSAADVAAAQKAAADKAAKESAAIKAAQEAAAKAAEESGGSKVDDSKKEGDPGEPVWE